MMIDFALEAERRHGKSAMEAMEEACLLRFRPIMLTTMAALLGALPLPISTGAPHCFHFILSAQPLESETLSIGSTGNRLVAAFGRSLLSMVTA